MRNTAAILAVLALYWVHVCVAFHPSLPLGTIQRKSSHALMFMSDAESLTVKNNGLLKYGEDVKLLDVVNVVGRFQGWDGVWEQPPPGTFFASGLSRERFKDKVRKEKFKSWPKDSSGQSVAAKLFPELDGPKGVKQVDSMELSEVALDAVFDTFNSASSHTERRKAEEQFAQWRQGDVFDVEAFESNLLKANLIWYSAQFVYYLVQFVAYWTIFIAPAIQYFTGKDLLYRPWEN
eukprot:CAMPEP_0113941566 /NCGR_PEP_ID=MMETSP1339-20121228/7456_1 /TAXON_ID=94617 /ORGANISM="Fibrocapsa japonica" /LENGTH=234 /DNA_ID=CAMNT_0000945747 /DNA_START=59 /DNA_END=763 /DNA_ORIENTATION=- /assembly_acc=CAM_ASM_000762